MRYAIEAQLYFADHAHVVSAQTAVVNAGAGFGGLDPSYHNGTVVADIHTDHSANEYLLIEAIGISPASMQSVFDFLVNQATALGVIHGPANGYGSNLVLRTVNDDGSREADQTNFW
jgi:hypothetical protein